MFSLFQDHHFFFLIWKNKFYFFVISGFIYICTFCFYLVLGIEPKLNILEIVKTAETVEVVIDPDAHHAEAEAHLVEEAQVITLDGTKHITTISDETSEQVTRWAAALEGYRKEQERLGIPYGNETAGARCRKG